MRRLTGAWRYAPVAAAGLSLLLALPVAVEATPRGIDTAAGLRRAYADARGRVVGISFTVKPMESETGVEGPKVDGLVCGVVVDPSGVILTAGDIFPEPGGDPRSIMAPTDFKVHFSAEKAVPAEAVGLDRTLNLAFLRVDPEVAPEMRPVEFREKPDLRVGDPVLIVGLMGRKYGYTPALYRATINAEVEGPVRLYGVDAILQDLTVGGLVLRSDGSTAGIVAKDVLGADFETGRTPGNLLSIIANMSQPQLRRPGYAMILPFAGFADAMESPPPVDLVTSRKRAWIGIVMQALNEDLRDYWSLPVPGGIIVGSVVEDSPAQAAEILPGDILTRVAGDQIRITEDAQLQDFRRSVERMEPGREIEIEIYRDGAPRTLTFALGTAPKTASLADDYEDEDFGLTVREITIDVQQALNLDPEFEGIVVESTEGAGWADVSGLAPQDIILSLGRTRVKTVGQFREALAEIKARQDTEAVFFVMRPPETRFVRVRTGFDASP
jgi:serine protease Do